MLHQKGVPAGAQASGAVDRLRRSGDAGASSGHVGHFIERDLVTDHGGRVRRPGPKKQPGKTARPEKILHAFNTWAFKREQPDSPEAMLWTIADAAKHGRPIEFVLYWGKGPRSRLDTPDTACLDYLSALVRRVGAVYEPGAAVKLIFTDTHAALNGHAPHDVQHYCAAVAAAAAAYDFSCCRLSELVRTAAGAARAASAPGLPDDTRQKLIACAAKWFKGDGTSEDGALRYYQMNLIEKRAVEEAFPSAIFVTFNGSEFRCLFPDRLPVFYMYSLRRGVSAKPWFLSSDTGSDAAPAIRR